MSHNIITRRVLKKTDISGRSISGKVIRTIMLQEWRAEKRTGADFKNFNDEQLAKRWVFCLVPPFEGIEPAMIGKQILQRAYRSMTTTRAVTEPSSQERKKNFEMKTACQAW